MVKWKSDLGLEARMLLTMFLLAVIYLAFVAFLFYVGVDQVFIVLFMGAFIFLQYFYSDRLILRSMGAKIVSESEAPELHEIVTRLCAIANLPKPKIAIVTTSMPNALATGRNQKSAVVAVTSGIMNQLNRSELEAVLAHELTHVKNRDAMVMTVATFISSIAMLMVRWLPMFGSGDRRSRDGGGIVAILLVSIAVWITSFLLIRALSRYREFAADRGSAIITGRPSNLASALMKISGFHVPTQDLRKVEGSASALFIVPAISGRSVMNLFSTHPSTEARIAALQRIEQEMEAA
ncbi:MAG: zinc metalloprotease HtpX [Methanotrichaceae archaeon]